MSTERREGRNTEGNEKRNAQQRLKVNLRVSDGMLQSEKLTFWELSSRILNTT